MEPADQFAGLVRQRISVITPALSELSQTVCVATHGVGPARWRAHAGRELARKHQVRNHAGAGYCRS